MNCFRELTLTADAVAGMSSERLPIFIGGDATLKCSLTNKN